MPKGLRRSLYLPPALIVSVVETTQKGRAAERLAAAYLQQRNLEIIQRNFRSRYGEIDLIARDQATLCFVEVRSRLNARFLSPIVSITASKQQRITYTAQCFLAAYPQAAPCRFDVVEVLAANLPTQQIIWTRDAFRLDGVQSR